ncbi:aquaporin-like protein, partial [Tricladium varicosporioides]
TMMERAPTMNIHRAETVLSKVDPLKHAFRGIFEALPEGARGHIVAMIGELIGTMFFIFFAFAGGETGAAASNDPKKPVSTGTKNATPALFLYIAFSTGFSLLVFAWTFFRISGGLFNPVISLGMALIGAITWARCALLSAVQIAATIAAAYMVKGLFSGELHVETVLGAGTSPAQGVIIEMLLTAQLAFAVFMMAAEKHQGTFLAPLGLGFSLFITELVGVFWTGGSVNPARSLAPCIVNRSFTSYHWIYWVGPIAGTCLAVILYKLVKALEYETAHGEEPE